MVGVLVMEGVITWSHMSRSFVRYLLKTLGRHEGAQGRAQTARNWRRMLLLAQPTLAAAGLVVLWLLALLIARYCGQPPPLQQRFERYLAYYESRAADWSGAAPPSGGKERARAYMQGEHSLLRMLSPPLWMPLELMGRTAQLSVLLATVQLKCAVAAAVLLALSSALGAFGAVLAASMCALPLKTCLDVLFESRSRARGFLPSAESGVLGGRLEQEEEAALVLERHVQVRALMTHVDSCHMLRSSLALWARNARFKAQLDDTAGLLHAKQALGWLGLGLGLGLRLGLGLG